MAGKSSSVKRMFEVEIVVVSTVDGRAKGELHAIEQPHDRAGHDVGAAVAHHAQRLFIFLGENP